MAILEVKNIHKSFGKTLVLNGISFSLEEGNVLSIIGSSGSGKTTLLRCITSLETADEGQIIVNGNVVFDSENQHKFTKDEIRRNRLAVGLVFQSFNLFPQYSVLDNVTLAVKLQAKNREDYKANKKQILAEIDEQGMELLRKVGLEMKKDAYPCELSGGQQQRVSIARALAKNPGLLLCDEPTGALDYRTSKQILSLLHRTCRDTGTTVVVITHNGALAAMADRIITINDGKIASDRLLVK